MEAQWKEKLWCHGNHSPTMDLSFLHKQMSIELLVLHGYWQLLPTKGPRENLGNISGIFPFPSLLTCLKTQRTVDSMLWKALEFFFPISSPPTLSLDLYHFTGITINLYLISDLVNFNFIMLIENGFQHQVQQINTWDSLGSSIFTFQHVIKCIWIYQVDSLN